jgi:hypothetical protein
MVFINYRISQKSIIKKLKNALLKFALKSLKSSSVSFALKKNA